MHQADHPVAGFQAAHLAADLRHFAGDIAAELHRHGKSFTAGDATLMAGRFAVEFAHLAGAVFHIPTRHRSGEYFHQHVAVAHLGHRVVAIDELVRAAEFEQTHGFHVGQP